MNLRQLKTLVWLRWRLMMSAWRRAGTVGRVILSIISVLAIISLVSMTIGAFVASLYLLPDAKPIHLMFIWDILLAVLLFAWSIGFLGELQRSEPLDLSKLLHLPMSLRGAFLLNYLTSFASLTLAFLLPVMLALCLAMTIVFGWRALISFPLLAGFLAVLTAVTYQVRGWLAKLMSNPRRRRAIITGLTMTMILAFQLPNLFNIFFFKSLKNRPKDNIEQKIMARMEDSSLTIEERDAAREEWEEYQSPEASSARRKVRDQEFEDWLFPIVRKANAWQPLGWLPYGICRGLEGSWLAGLLGSAGLFGLAGLSLNTAYRSTLRFYRRAPSASAARKAQATSSNQPDEVIAKRNALAKPFPWLSPIPAMIARANFVSMWRAPEFKMMLIGPAIVMVILMVVTITNHEHIPEKAAPFIALAMSFSVIILAMPVLLNQFGFDRHAFRSFLLLPVSGRDLLLAKNVSLAPYLLPLALIGLLVAQFFYSIGFFTFLAAIIQVVTAYVLTCCVGNIFSVYFPMTVASSAMRKVQPRWQVVVAQMVAFFLLPIVLIPVVAPTLVGFFVAEYELLPWLPVTFLLSLFVFVVTLIAYHDLLKRSGQLLQTRSRKILSEITREGK